jgi:hypothetical protein
MLMRRAFATILAALFSFELIAPVLLADAASDVPACCRRNGKHHCAMADGSGDASTGPSLKSLESKCPFFPKSAAVTGHSKTIALSVTPPACAPDLMGSAVAASGDNLSRTTLRGPVRKRGPPPCLD